ncbi:unnamed protein product [Urochloa humidicola]
MAQSGGVPGPAPAATGREDDVEEDGIGRGSSLESAVGRSSEVLGALGGVLEGSSNCGKDNRNGSYTGANSMQQASSQGATRS